jgi:hypothetical protein
MFKPGRISLSEAADLSVLLQVFFTSAAMGFFSVIRKSPSRYWKACTIRALKADGGEERKGHLTVVQIHCEVEWEKIHFVVSTQPKLTRGFTHILLEVLLRLVEDDTSSLNGNISLFVHGGYLTSETFSNMYAV